MKARVWRVILHKDGKSFPHLHIKNNMYEWKRKVKTKVIQKKKTTLDKNHLMSYQAFDYPLTFDASVEIGRITAK